MTPSSELSPPASEALRSALDAALSSRCGFGLDLACSFERGGGELRWLAAGRELARAEASEDWAELAEDLLDALQDPRAELCAAMRDQLAAWAEGQSEGWRAAWAAAGLGERAAEVEVEVEDAGTLHLQRHWTTEAELEQGYPRFLLRLSLGEEAHAFELDPYHPQAPLDVELGPEPRWGEA